MPDKHYTEIKATLRQHLLDNYHNKTKFVVITWNWGWHKTEFDDSTDANIYYIDVLERAKININIRPLLLRWQNNKLTTLRKGYENG